MKKNGFFLMLMIILLMYNQCKTIQISDLRPPSSINLKLPQLTPKVDMHSLYSAYTEGATVQKWVGKVSVADKRNQDIVTLFERDVMENICSIDKHFNNGNPVGSIYLKVTFSKTKLGGYGWIIPAIMTGTVAWWFGMPVQNVQQEIELQVEIKNKSNEIVGKYVASASGKADVAAYFGYNKLDAPHMFQSSVGRKSNIIAYNEAMREIKMKIRSDYNRLINELK